MKTSTALVTGANHGLGLALTAQLLTQGWQVFAGRYEADWSEVEALQEQFPTTLRVVSLDISSTESVTDAARTVAAQSNSLDLLINNAAVFSPSVHANIRQPQDYDEMLRLFNVNTMGALRTTEAFLPLLDAGSLKRLCYISSEAGSIARSSRSSWFGYCQSKVALNMTVQILFNDLHPQGYTFRLYHPGWMRSYMNGGKDIRASMEPEEAAIPALAYFLNSLEQEDRLAMRDWQGQEWPW